MTDWPSVTAAVLLLWEACAWAVPSLTSQLVTFLVFLIWITLTVIGGKFSVGSAFLFRMFWSDILKKKTKNDIRATDFGFY